jgi:hypothetical protein
MVRDAGISVVSQTEESANKTDKVKKKHVGVSAALDTEQAPSMRSSAVNTDKLRTHSVGINTMVV